MEYEDKADSMLPNTTPYPNVILDVVMRFLSGSGTKCANVLIRKTYGWHKRRDRIALSQICHIAGLEPNAAKSGMRELEHIGIVKDIIPGGGNTITTYEIELDFRFDQNVIQRILNNAEQKLPKKVIKIMDKLITQLTTETEKRYNSGQEPIAWKVDILLAYQKATGSKNDTLSKIDAPYSLTDNEEGRKTIPSKSKRDRVRIEINPPPPQNSTPQNKSTKTTNKNIKQEPSPVEMLIDRYGKKEYEAALSIASSRGKKDLRYLEGILRNRSTELKIVRDDDYEIYFRQLPDMLQPYTKYLKFTYKHGDQHYFTAKSDIPIDKIQSALSEIGLEAVIMSHKRAHA